MADPVVSITNGVPTSGTGTITTLGQTLVDGANATIGITTGAAVTTNAAGTLQQYLRGIVSLLVSGITVASHAVTNAGTFAVQATLQAGSAIVGKVGIDQTTDGTTNKVAADLRVGGAAVDKGAGTGGTATPRVIIDSSQFSALGQTTMSASAPVVIASDQSAVPFVQKSSAVTAGNTPSRINAAASTNATSLKASAGNIDAIDVFNPAAYNVFLKLYNKASAPTVGTDTPVMTIPVQAGGGYSKTWPKGFFFSTGIAYAITKLQADSDTTVVVAGDLTGNLLWI